MPRPRPRFQFSLKLLLLLLLIAGPLASFIAYSVQQYRQYLKRQAVVRSAQQLNLGYVVGPPPATPPTAPILLNEEFPFANIDATTSQIPLERQHPPNSNPGDNPE